MPVKTMAADRIKVLIVDDSALMRSIIGHMLSDDEQIDIVGWAKNGFEAVAKTKSLRPDVVSLDIEMPELDGLEALRIIMRESPTRVLVLSGSDRPGIVYDALYEGAVDFVSKPSGPVSYDLEKIKADLLSKIHATALAQLKNLKKTPRAGRVTEGRTAGFGEVYLLPGAGLSGRCSHSPALACRLLGGFGGTLVQGRTHTGN
jgi:two-component system chemotaxis response regulator CheB